MRNIEKKAFTVSLLMFYFVVGPILFLYTLHDNELFFLYRPASAEAKIEGSPKFTRPLSNSLETKFVYNIVYWLKGCFSDNFLCFCIF